MKKKYLAIILAIFAVLSVIVVVAKATDAETVGAVEVQTDFVSEGSVVFPDPVETEAGAIETEAATMETASVHVTETVYEPIPEVSETVAETDVLIDIDEAEQIINSSGSLSEAILKVAERWGISTERAERLVSTVKSWGDEHLADNELWQALSADIVENPAGYILFAVVVLLLVTVIGLLVRRVISDMGQIRSIKLDNAKIKQALLGDDDDAETSLRALMTAKNKEVEAMKEEMAALRESVDVVDSEFSKVNESIDALSETVSSMKADTAKAADVSLETGLQITQLIGIALDRKTPIVSSEARKLWYDSSRAKLLERAGVTEDKSADNIKNGGDADAGKA